MHLLGWGTIVCVGAIAAFMSTADSQILAMSSIITKDGLPEITEIKEENEKQIGRILIIILAIIGLILAYDLQILYSTLFHKHLLG